MGIAHKVSLDLSAMTPRTRRRVTLFAAAFAVATGAFWGTMLTTPPVTVAAGKGFSVLELQRNAPLDLPSGVADAI